MSRRKNPPLAEWAVRLWNACFPPGTEVDLVEDGGKKVTRTRTRSQAWQTSDGSPLVLVEGRSGGYTLSRIMPAFAAVFVVDNDAAITPLEPGE
jgi:hypothetical protein